MFPDYITLPNGMECARIHALDEHGEVYEIYENPDMGIHCHNSWIHVDSGGYITFVTPCCIDQDGERELENLVGQYAFRGEDAPKHAFWREAHGK